MSDSQQARAAASHEVCPLVAEVLSSLVQESGRVALPASALHAFERRFSAVPNADREHTLQDLVAAAVKLKRLGGDAALPAIESLCGLAGVVADRARAEAAFSAQGLATRAHKQAIGSTGGVVAPAAEAKPKAAAPKPKRGLR